MKKQELKRERYAGLIDVRRHGDSGDVLFIIGFDEPFAKTLEWMRNKQVSVRYWITDVRCTVDEASDAFLRRCFGDADVKFRVHYSDLTGYLWTDEDLNVGGHDLLAELKSFEGKWLILEVEECK